MPKLLFFFVAMVGAVQGSLLLNALPAVLGTSARVVLQDSIFLLFIAYTWKVGGGYLKVWWSSPISALCIVFLVMDVVVQLFHGLATPKFSLFAVFRESRLVAYFLLALLCFGSVNRWAIRGAAAVTLQLLFVFAGLGAVIFMFLATQVIFSGNGSSEFFSSKQDAIDAGFGNGLQEKFKSPPIMVAFLMAYLMALLISSTSSRRPLMWLAWKASLLIGLASVLAVALFSNTRSLVVASLIGLAAPLAIEAARATILGRARQVLLLRSIALVLTSGILVAAAVITLLQVDQKFTEQVAAKNFFDDRSDSHRFGAVKKAATFDVANPIGYGIGSGSNYIQLEGFWMNPIDSGTFHVLITFGYQFLIPFLILHCLALGRAFKISVKPAGDPFDFSLRSGISAGLLVNLLSFYQTSPFLFPADAMLSGAALGAALSYYRFVEATSVRNLQQPARSASPPKGSFTV